MTDSTKPDLRVRNPLFENYRTVRVFLRSAEGRAAGVVRETIKDLETRLIGTQKNPVDWTDPDRWIPERLEGPKAEWALQVWMDSQRQVNPRYLYGPWLLARHYRLMLEDAHGILRLSEKGRAFLEEEPAAVRWLDDREGLLEILRLLASGPQRRMAEILPEWQAFLKLCSRIRSTGEARNSLRRRLTNLRERGLVGKEGNSYAITPAGLDYLGTAVGRQEGPKADLRRAVRTYNTAQVHRLKEALGKMPPYRFEHMVGDLLEAMGYEDVVVTKESGDKGVDVVATTQFGISTFKEVVQVKRQQGTIGRPVLDGLRGGLHYFGALRGTLITVGRFSKECQEAALFPGAPPIGLIDGKRLVELLLEHGIGIRKTSLELTDFDADYFAEDEGNLESEDD
jgi:restriction system protein